MIRISQFPKRFCAANKRRQYRDGLSAILSAVASGSGTTGARRPMQVRLLHHSVARLESMPLPSDYDDRRMLESWQDNVRGSDAWLVGRRGPEWWTGPAPLPGVCPGVLDDGTIMSLPLPNVRKATREDLLAYFDNTWALTEVLFSALQGQEAFYRPPYHGLRHPLMFYYGHPAVLYVNKLRVAGLLQGPINEYFEGIFEVGVDEMSWDDMTKNHMAWPSVEEVRDYRRQVYQAVRDVILRHPAYPTLAKQGADSPFWAVVMGFEHERIHIETSSVLFRELPASLLRHPEQWPKYHPAMQRKHNPMSQPRVGVDYPELELLQVPEGTVTLGKPRDFPSFGWDNEYGSKEMHVKSFRAGKHMVTNGEFYEFVTSGGYFNQRYWSEEGWKWRCFRNLRHPTFWVPTGPNGLQAYRFRTVFEELDMPWANPVDVNFHEAKAYCKWLSERHGRTGEHQYRTMTEAEHNKLRDPVDIPTDDLVMLPRKRREDSKANLNLAYGITSPVDAFPPTKKGFHDVFGSAWEWCEDHFNPLPGFQTHHLYDDFSLPCFDGRHHMIMGGSFASTGDEASHYARFHFRPHFFQHAGFRIVEPNPLDPTLMTSCMDNKGPFAGENPYRSSQDQEAIGKAQYEDHEWLMRYLHLHYPEVENEEAFPAFLPREALRFPQRCADVLIDTAKSLKLPMDRALDLGCAVGGSSFALAKEYKEVQGIELSQSFVDMALRLQTEGEAAYHIKAEGDLRTSLTARVPADVDRSRVVFSAGDALSLPTSLGSFDAVLVANVVCRLATPVACLERMVGPQGIVRPGGLLMLTTPFSWKEEFTRKEMWLGGRYGADGSPVQSLDGLKAALHGLGFRLVKEQDMPLVIRMHSRLYEFIGPRATVWQYVGKTA